jgi:hypothetical protein
MMLDLPLDRLMMLLAAVNLVVLLLTAATCRVVVRVRLRRRKRVDREPGPDFATILEETESRPGEALAAERGIDVTLDDARPDLETASRVPTRAEARLATDLADWRKRHGAAPEAGDLLEDDGTRAERLRSLLERLDPNGGGKDGSARAEAS